MSLLKPYPRIYRPYTKDVTIPLGEKDYINDPLYVDIDESESLLGGARLIVEDVQKVFEYIEPCDNNLNTYSHRIYELFIRCSTEFETNCKGVLNANQYVSSNRHFSINDYYKLNRAMKLSEYEIQCMNWNTQRRFKPFEDWDKDRRLTWYHDYNLVKHNRSTMFQLANLRNLMMSLCGLIVILAAQFDQSIGKVSSSGLSLTFRRLDNSFTVIPFTVFRPLFTEEESYGFDWTILKNEPNPIQNYDFNNK